MTGLQLIQQLRAMKEHEQTPMILMSAAIPAEACYLGWQESLALLAKLVEAEIPD